MKTPRDLLLARHQSATPQLDALRAQTLAAAFAPAPGARAPHPTHSPHAFLRECWQELFWQPRRAWFGLAAVWIAILTTQVATADKSAELRRAAAEAPLLRFQIQEQLRLRAELLNDTAPSAPASPVPPPIIPPHRSEIPRHHAIA